MAPLVLSLGGINADLQLRLDSLEDFGRAARPGRDLRRLSGGKGANVAVQARRLGCEAWLLGRTGDDAAAEQALGPLRAEGVNLGHVRRARGEQTGVALLAVGPDGAKRSVSAPEANFGFGEEDERAVLRAIEAAPAGAVLVADYEISPHVASRAIAAARVRGMPVVLDPSYPRLADRRDFAAVTALTPNEREARDLAGAGGDAPLSRVARTLAGAGARTTCIKLDGGGCLLLCEGRMWRQHAVAGEVVDTSGAGDAFSGALAVALAEGRDILTATLMAVAASELAVGRYGAQASYPTRAQLQERLLQGTRPLVAWVD
jgi:ribokinase